MIPHNRYSLHILASAVFGAAGQLVSEIAFRRTEISALEFATVSNIVGGAFLLVIARMRGTSESLSWSRVDLTRLAMASTAMYAIGFLLAYEAIDLIGVSKFSLLGRLEVVFIVALAVWFLGESWSLKHWLATLSAVFGAALTNLHPEDWQLQVGRGEVLTVLSTMVFAGGIVALKPLLHRQDGKIVTGAGLLIGATMLAPALLLESGAAVQRAVLTSPLALLLVAFRGVLLAMSWVTFNVAIVHIGASRGSAIFLTIVPFTVIMQLVTSELAPSIGLRVPENLSIALIGGAIVLGAVLVIQRQQIQVAE
ncbi:MAG: DMT family transporter [Candidatus Latescibacterota bacterium]|nr:DMT family transporter [Candidatus Latescibacterota bacterium]